jgi:hypothetical protein
MPCELHKSQVPFPLRESSSKVFFQAIYQIFINHVTVQKQGASFTAFSVKMTIITNHTGSLVKTFMPKSRQYNLYTG